MSYYCQPEFARHIKRYLGRTVVVQVSVYEVHLGTLSEVSDDFIVLTNTIKCGEDHASRFEIAIQAADLKAGDTVGEAESTIPLGCIHSITCDDELIPPTQTVSSSVLNDVAATCDLRTAKPGFIETTRAIQIRIGAGLICLIDETAKSSLPKRIAGLRNELANTLGFHFPDVRITDDLSLDSNEYQILAKGAVAGTGIIHTKQYLAIKGLSVVEIELEGIVTNEPAFGLPAIWLSNDDDRTTAEQAGYSVVDAKTVLVTHLGEVVKRTRHDLLSYEMMASAFYELRALVPSLTKHHFDTGASLQSLYLVLCELLKEQVWIGDLESIAQSVAVRRVGNPTFPELVALVRIDIGRQILRNIADDQRKIPAIMFDLELDKRFQDSSFLSNPKILHRLAKRIRPILERSKNDCRPVVVFIGAGARAEFSKFLRRMEIDAVVISEHEVPIDYKLDVYELIGFQEIIGIDELKGDTHNDRGEQELPTECRATSGQD